MRIAIIGTGYVGLVTGACLADMGNEVVCFDIDKNKIRILKKGELPFYEPDLKEIVQYNLKEARLQFTNDPKTAISKANMIYIAVGTPPNKDGSVDMGFIESAAETIGKYLNDYKVIATKSTVPVGTNENIKKIITQNLKTLKKLRTRSANFRLTGQAKIKFSVVSNPEFLREGNAVKDFYNPDRIVFGFEKGDKRAKEVMFQIYRSITRSEKPVVSTDLRTAETIKYAANSFLATKISFINEIANFCEKINANIDDVAQGIGLDSRIGPRFLQAGLGYGGSCFPKDVKALINTGKNHGYDFQIIKSAEDVNKTQKLKVVEKLYSQIKNLNQKTVTFWGLSFKANTDDVRESASIDITKKLLEDFPKIKINVYDPEGLENFKSIFPQKNIKPYQNMYQALKNTSALLVLTEWDQFKLPDFHKMKKMIKTKLVIDGRNLYDPRQMKKEGFKYLSIGRR